MKKILFLILIGLGVFGWFSGDLFGVLQLFGITPPAGTMATRGALPGVAPGRTPTMDDFARLAKSDPAEFQKAIAGFKASPALNGTLSTKSMTVSPSQAQQAPMSIEEFAKLSASDPEAFKKFLASLHVKERTEGDKLMNFFAHGKYE